MTNTPTHYFNFKPCDQVVQFRDGGVDQNIAEVCELLGANPAEDYEFFEAEYEACLPSGSVIYYGYENECVTPGQWVIRQDGKVWVQDEEPARAERWLFGSPTEGFQWVEGVGLIGTLTHRRPVVTVGDQEWLGPWETVDEPQTGHVGAG